MPDVKRAPKPDDPKRREQAERKLKQWTGRLRRAEREMEEAGGHQSGKQGLWADLVDMYAGDQWGRKGRVDDKNRVTSNVIKGNLDALRPQLYFRNPKINASPKNPDVLERDEYEIDPRTGQPLTVPVPDPQTGQEIPVPIVRIPRGTAVRRLADGTVVDAAKQAKLAEEIVNYWHGETPVKVECRKALNDALILPFGCVKQTWLLETDLEETPIDLEDPDRLNEPPREIVVSEKPWIERVPPWRLLFDPDLEEWDLTKAKWVAHVQYRTRREVESDPQLDQKVVKEKAPTKYGAKEGGDKPSEVHPDDEVWKVLEIHDYVENRIMVLVEGNNRFARDEPNPYKAVEGGVFTAVGFDDLPNQAYPLPIVKQIISKQEALNLALSMQMDHIARFNQKWAGETGTFKDTEERRKFLEGGDGTYVELSDLTRPPIPLAAPPVTPDLYNIVPVLERAVTKELGVPSFQQGQREPGVDTATEANLIAGGGDNKTNEKRDKVNDFYRTISRKTLQICQIYMDQPLAIEIAGEKGREWRKMSRRDIQGEFSLEVDVYSGQPFDPIVEKRQSMEMYGLASQSPYFDQVRLAQWLAKKHQIPEEIVKNEYDARAQVEQNPEAFAQSQAQRQRPAPVSEGPARAGDIQGQILGANRAERY